MRFKNMFLISIILLAIFSVGVVCAENITDGTGNSTNSTVPVNGTNSTVPVNGTNSTVPVNKPYITIKTPIVQFNYTLPDEGGCFFEIHKNGSVYIYDIDNPVVIVSDCINNDVWRFNLISSENLFNFHHHISTFDYCFMNFMNHFIDRFAHYSILDWIFI